MHAYIHKGREIRNVHEQIKFTLITNTSSNAITKTGMLSIHVSTYVFKIDYLDENTE